MGIMPQTSFVQKISLLGSFDTGCWGADSVVGDERRALSGVPKVCSLVELRHGGPPPLGPVSYTGGNRLLCA
jgi:hypothetical protein